MSYLLIFITGLTTGGLSCLALQGGLLASAILEADTKKSRAKPIALFLLAKLVAYTILGFLLGWLSETLSFGPKVIGGLSFFIAFFMLGVALQTLEVHPIFRYFIVQPPKFLRDRIYKKSQEKSSFAAILLGIFTVLIPCGTTQAMMALAVSSGNPLNGALTLFFFVLGTIPIFFALAYFATKLGEKHQKLFSRIIAIMLIGLSIFTMINGLRLFGVSFSNHSSAPISQTEVLENVALQKIEIKISDSNGYSPSLIRLKNGVPVEITLTNDGARGCIRSFVIPDLNKKAIVPTSGSTTITFTPTKVGKINFTCSMGMYNGQFIVEE